MQGSPAAGRTLDEATWDSLVDTNLKAAFFCPKAEAAQMKLQGGGAIVFKADWPTTHGEQSRLGS